MKRKERLTVTVDLELVRAGNEAVAAGQASSLSSWVNRALADRAAKERRLRALGDAVLAYEAEHGEISIAELERQARADQRAAVVVRGRPPPARRAGRGGA